MDTVGLDQAVDKVPDLDREVNLNQARESIVSTGIYQLAGWVRRQCVTPAALVVVLTSM